MIVGMGFEVLLLNNLLILLNYLTQTDTAIPQIVSYFVEILILIKFH